ncbi:MAG: hypothetical protein P9M13_04960 [Candidatus Ancaeobacter aquaticus]|nr:hypothetical protein [Candidatus Ancaeobacter aquaticus]
MRALYIIFLSLFCGVGQIVKRQYVRGIVILLLYAYCLSHLIMGLFGLVYLDHILMVLLFLVVSFVWLYNLLDIREMYVVDGKVDTDGSDTDDQLYEKGRVCSLKGDLTQAKECFEILYMRNKEDMDTVYQLAKIYKECDENAQARKLFKKYLKKGDKLEWIEEAKEALGAK